MTVIESQRIIFGLSPDYRLACGGISSFGTSKSVRVPVGSRIDGAMTSDTYDKKKNKTRCDAMTS
jgi:hypothetical protein